MGMDRGGGITKLQQETERNCLLCRQVILTNTDARKNDLKCS